MDVKYSTNSEAEVVPKDSPNPESEKEYAEPAPDSTTPDIVRVDDTSKEGILNTSNSEDEKQKESKIQTLKRLVTGKGKNKNEEKPKEESPLKTEKSHSSRELRKSLSRVFSVSSSSPLGRVWNSLSATRINGAGEAGSTKTIGRVFNKKPKPESEEESSTPNNNEPNKTFTLGRRFTASFKNAFGRSKES